MLKPTHQGRHPIYESACKIKKDGHWMLVRMLLPSLSVKLPMREGSFTAAQKLEIMFFKYTHIRCRVGNA